MDVVRTMAPYGILPVGDDLTQPYWEGARQGKLLVQRCQTCRYYNHPPVYLCANCKDRDASLAFEQVSGRGSVYTYYMAHDTSIVGFEDKAPYPVIIVELEEQPGLFIMSNLLNCEFDAFGSGIDIGMPVEVVFEKASDEIAMPQFQPATT